jgi:hypothetical protein
VDCYVHRDGLWDLTVDIVSQDGDAAMTYNAPTYVYTVEFAIPLGRSDADDMATTAGALIGVYFCMWDNANLYIYPNGTASVTFQLATAPSGIGTSILPICFLVFAFLIALDIVHKNRSNLLK